MATKTPQICIFDNEKQYFCTLCTWIFHLLTFWRRSRSTWNDLFCSCVDDISIWWQKFNFVFLCPKRWFQFNSGTVGTHFSSIITLNNWKMIAETRSYIFRWRSRFRRRRVCLSSRLFPRFPACIIWSVLSIFHLSIIPSRVRLAYVWQMILKANLSSTGSLHALLC